MNFDIPHRRFNPLTREWVLVSPHRAQRPWLGQVEKAHAETLPPYDPDCYLCPGNTRSSGSVNPHYSGTFVFDNDFPALLQDEASESFTPSNSLFNALPERGICRVVCFSPRHDLTLPQLSQAEVERVVSTWKEETTRLGGVGFVRYVQVFENKGEMMGCSNPHPHSQIWASSSIPNEPAQELNALADYRQAHGSCLLCDYLAQEQKDASRVVCSNEHFTALVPFWAVWPFELLILSQRHCGSLPDLTLAEITGLADLLRRVTARYDNLFEISFPYSMGFHQAPSHSPSDQNCHLHAHFYPPLLRSATVRKFMVGYEMLAMPQRDLTPETAAERLRGLSERHYLQQA
jgi:UDPglucose--hexose-1-phosphate uridylyltransferase